MSDRPVCVARIIGRLNIGGPAIQAITLTKLLEQCGYDTTLIRGEETGREGSMDYLADELGVTPVRIPGMGRELGPRDLSAFMRLVLELRRIRPQLVHTHLAKAGTLGRLAALVPGRGRPRVVVHTFHGHSLSGYFSPRKTAFFLAVECFLARRTTRLIAISPEVRDDLVRLGVAPADKIEVIRLGFDLARFQVDEVTRQRKRHELRDALNIPENAALVVLVARLVPIKRVDRFLRIASLLGHSENVWFMIAGDGELRDELRETDLPATLRERIVWAGFQRDVPAVCFAADVVVLTSDNEGTPVSLIEAQAAGVPVVSTDVGGAATVVLPSTGRLVAVEDVAGFAAAVEELLSDPALRSRMGAEGRAHAMKTFALDRLVSDVDELYRRLLSVG